MVDVDGGADFGRLKRLRRGCQTVTFLDKMAVS